MTYEEKKAIEIIKFLQDKCMQENGTGMMPIYRIDDLANAIEILLNLIEKQSKEIEELEKNRKVSQNFAKIVATDYISKDKIKAKIEEVQNMKAKAKDIVFKSSLNYIETELQSLLEKE